MLTTNIVSVFGSQISLIASNTFPTGITLSQFPDDADPFDIPEVQIGDAGMGPNGDMLAWSKGVIIPFNLNIIAGSDDDKLLSILMQANRVSKGKRSLLDVITITIVYPDGGIATFSNGIMNAGIPARSGTAAGKMKAKSYKFMFKDYVAD
jgi:hypothetical protein